MLGPRKIIDISNSLEEFSSVMIPNINWISLNLATDWYGKRIGFL